MQEQATFTAMTEGTPDDYAIIARANGEHAKALADRILDHLALLKGDTGGFAIDRYRHCLQTATRAYRDGRDNEYVVCALLHDIGDTLASANHADLAATMLEPFVSKENYWIVKHHGIFQGYYFFEHLGLNKNMRDEFRDSEYWHACAEFCAKYDQNSFDPDYEDMPIEEFIPMVKEVFRHPKTSIYKRREENEIF